MSYTIAKRDPISRVRLLISDTNIAAEVFSDDEVKMALVEKEHGEFLYIYYDEDFDSSITAATVETRSGASSYEFKLKRSLEAMSLFEVGVDRSYDTIQELIRGVQALSKGYQIGVSLLGGDIEWLSLDFYYYPETYVSLGDIRNAVYRRSRDLALTEGAKNIYGAANMKRLSMASINLAAAYLLRCIMGDPSTFKKWRAQNVEWERPYDYIQSKIRQLEGMKMLGVKSLWTGTAAPDRDGYMIPHTRLPR